MKLKNLEFIGRKLRPMELRLFVKWLLNLKRTKITLPDNRVYETDPISDLGLRLAKDKAYEPVMTQTIERLLEDGDCFVDLGANEGYFSVLGAKLVSARGKVFSIEPQQRLWTVIQNNLLLNDLCNVQLLAYGIGSKKQDLVLQLYPSINSGASSFSSSFNFKISFNWIRKKLYGQQLAKIIRLDDLVSVFPSKIKLIKIDIEGFELEALKGATNLLETKSVRHLLIELHPEALRMMNQSTEMIDKVLKEIGYEKNIIEENLVLYSL